MLLNACPEAVEWAATQPDLETAWANCQRGDWMLWLSHRVDFCNRKAVGAAAGCMRTVLHLFPDPRITACVDAYERYASGEADHVEVPTLDEAIGISNVGYVQHVVIMCVIQPDDMVAKYAARAIAASMDAPELESAHLAVCADIVRRHHPAPPPLVVSVGHVPRFHHRTTLHILNAARSALIGRP